MRRLRASSNFEVLRLLAVVILVAGNGIVLTGGSPPGLWGAPLPRVGLDLWFAISGYLLAESALRRDSLVEFARARAWRVFPALAVSVIVTAFVIGPLATALPLREYLLSSGSRRYLYNVVLLPRPFLPGTFEGQQWSGAANPMLWTLSAYLLCAAVVFALARLTPGWQVRAALGCAAIGATAALAWPAATPFLPRALLRPEISNALPELPFLFVAAALGFAARRGGAGLWRADLAMLCFAATWVSATWIGEATIVVAWLTLPYMAACVGRMTLPGLGPVGWVGRASYGIFLYAFPLQQLIVARAPGLQMPILACFGLATVCGLLSFYGIERWLVPPRRVAS